MPKRVFWLRPDAARLFAPPSPGSLQNHRDEREPRFSAHGAGGLEALLEILITGNGCLLVGSRGNNSSAPQPTRDRKIPSSRGPRAPPWDVDVSRPSGRGPVVGLLGPRTVFVNRAEERSRRDQIFSSSGKSPQRAQSSKPRCGLDCDAGCGHPRHDSA